MIKKTNKNSGGGPTAAKNVVSVYSFSGGCEWDCL